MPAVDLFRLRLQVAQLIELFSQPEGFLRQFHDLLGLYNQWTLREGMQTTPKTLMRSYNAPLQVIRQIELGIKPVILSEPHVALNLADLLWQDNFLESREMAAYILGQIPIMHIEDVKSRILDWANPNLDSAALDALFNKATSRLLTERPEIWEGIMENFLSHYEPIFQSYGLKAITGVIKNPDFNQVPSLFKLLRPFIQSPQSETIINLTKAVAALAERTPIETVYFLKQILAVTQGPEVEQFIRRCLPYFPLDLQRNLQEALRSHAKRIY